MERMVERRLTCETRVVGVDVARDGYLGWVGASSTGDVKLCTADVVLGSASRMERCRHHEVSIG